MKKEEYLEIKKKLMKDKKLKKEIEDIEKVKFSDITKQDFFEEYVWAVLSAGMGEKVVEKIFPKIMHNINSPNKLRSIFAHKGKVDAILYTKKNLDTIWKSLNSIKSFDEKIEFLDSLKYIGEVNKYHLARNIGFNTAKPDRHLVRIARHYKTTPEDLCNKLAKETGDKVGVVDAVLWRASERGLIDTKKL